ncbi:MAG: hypothetical protein WCE62_08995 [Polyangiales bacterium]
MSQVLTVPTHFNDIGELSEGFLDRVERDTLILYGPVAYEDGSEIEFVLLLADGSPALEGAGRVRAAVDGGAERVPETRYDIVVEALQLDGRNEVVFERLVLSRQAVSDRPPIDEAEPATDQTAALPADEGETLADDQLAAGDEPLVEEFDLAEDEVFSVPPEQVAFDTAPPPVTEQEEDDEDHDSATVIAAVDAEAIMAEALDSEYAFEHGIASEPRVGMPVPIPSMAAPPDAPPAPPTLRLAEPPEGLTRPSLARAEDLLFAADGEVSDVHTTGLFVYEEGLPIPSRPPFPDPDRPRRAPPVEAAGEYGVEESEPPQTNDDEYEEVRLSDFAGAVEEG